MKRFSLGFISFLIIILGLQIVIPIINASAVDDEVSWSESEPVLAKSEVSDSSETPCAGSLRMMLIDNNPQAEEVCIILGKNINFGWYADGNVYRTIVGFGLDSKMYPIETGCQYKSDCLYSASQDELIVRKQFVSNQLQTWSIIVYKNFSKNIRITSNYNNFTKIYKAEFSEAYYPVSLENGYSWPVNSMGISKDGKWLAIELHQRGFGLLNLETLEFRRVSSYTLNYNGSSPNAQLAVSDDGVHIAVTGDGGGLSMFDVKLGCGTAFNFENMVNVPNTYIDNCPHTFINPNKFMDSFLIGIQPELNENGSEFIFKANSYIDANLYKKYYLRTKGYVTPKINYLAIGDSYSSGEGDLVDSNYAIGTNVDYEKCHLSLNSYPYVVSHLLGMVPNMTKSVACSGAVTDDVIGSDDDYWGQGNRLYDLMPNITMPRKNYLQSYAKDIFLPGRIHQETFAKNYQPKIITIGIGGNDVGFADKLKACLSPNTCSWAGTAEGREKTALEMKTLFDKLVTTYGKLQNDSPDAKIYAIGYPRFIESSGECTALQDLLLDQVERTFIDQGVIYLNDIIEAAAKKVGIKYISIEDSFGDHKICGSSPQAAENFIKTGDDMGLPGEWLNWVKLVGQESFHPNALGHQLSSAAISAAVNGDLANYDYCNGLTSCAQDVSAPEPSEYWIPSGVRNYAKQKFVDIVNNILWTNDRIAKMRIRLATYATQPLTMVRVEIFSNPRFLGEYATNDDGSLSVDIELPADLEYGYHTVHVYGKSYSGEDIDLYQVIRYFKPEPAVENKSPEVIRDNSNKISNNTSSTTAKVEYSIDKPATGSALASNSWTDGVLGDDYPNTSILATSTTKQKPNIEGKAIENQSSDAISSIIFATFCAMLISILVAISVRFYNKLN